MSACESVDCNLCKGIATRTLIADDTLGLVACKRCGLVYRNPRIAEGERVKDIVDNDIAAKRNRAVWYDSKLKLFERGLDKIEKWTGKGRLLDVGCGHGTFLDMAKNRGWEVAGVEISPSASKYAEEALGLQVFAGTLSEASFRSGHFRVVTLWDVLDMMGDPSAELLEIRRVLEEDGLLVLRIRNVTFHLRAQLLLGRLARGLRIRPSVCHLYGFSRRTMRAMLEKAGFEGINVMNSEPTTGDASGTGRLLTLKGMKFIKMAAHLFCQALFYMTGGRAVLAPSMLVFARKPS